MSIFDLDRLVDLFLYNVVAAAIGILRDRQRAEEKRARESANLAAAGKAVSALAHDMKTPLIAIGGFSELVKRYIREDHPHRDKLDIIIGETRRLENMVKDMLDFSRPLELNCSIDHVDEVIEECLRMIEGEARRRKILVKHKSAPGLSATSIDRMRMKQVLINLIMNAIQASPEGETVLVEAYQKRNQSIIEVTDCGCGVPLDLKTEIFAPFFSTKKDGTGLGLPIVRKIVEAHQGKVLLLDNNRCGSTFRLILPMRQR
jgi:signal transduction histidine kinase